MSNFSSLKQWLGLALMALGLTHCGANPSTLGKTENSEINFDSSRLIALDAKIAAGSLLMPATVVDPIEQESLIRKQLKYTVGQINDYRGVPHLESIAIQIAGAAPDTIDPTRNRVAYAAQFLMSWPRATAIPEHLALYLPAAGEQDFINQYLNDQDGAKRCMDQESHGVDASTAFYYYRPLKTSCEIKSGSLENVIVIDALLAKSAVNTEGKAPEYQKVWEDGRLAVTLVFAKNDGNSMALDDAGTSAYRSAYQSLVRAYGKPLTSNLPMGLTAPAVDQTFALMTFNTPSGVLDIDLELISQVGAADTKDFEQRYSERMAIADFVSYSGHSGLGSNIAQLMKMGTFVKGQYQILRLNGCDSFAYYTDELFAAHSAVNPGESGTKYLDLITNSQPSKFSTGAWEAMTVIDALVGKKLTYRQILAKMDGSQLNSVTGEEDNN